MKAMTTCGDCYGGREAWVSECGDYVAIYWGDGVLDVDVIHRDGHIWRGRRKHPRTYDDWDRPEYQHAEFPRMVTGWSNCGHRKRSGEWVKAFELSFCNMDQTKDQHRDKTAGANLLDAVFRRQVPPKRPRRWVRKILDAYREPQRTM